MGVNFDLGFTRFWIYTTECFKSRTDFLKGIWKLTCSSCSGLGERAKIGALRTATKLGSSFFLTTELVFTVLAIWNDAHTHKDYVRGCSPMSTVLRGSENYITGAIGRDLTLAMQTLGSVRNLVAALEEELAMAEGAGVQSTPIFQELWKTYGDHSCARFPPRVWPHLSASEHDYVPDSDLELEPSDDGFLHEKASPSRPFGQCQAGRDCPLTGQYCRRWKDRDGKSRTNCACRAGYCQNVTESGEDMCERAVNVGAQVAEGIRKWLGTMELRIGKHTSKLLWLQNSTAGTPSAQDGRRVATGRADPDPGRP
mmetsp:Transcript_51545/g.159585  ORF Transcript_51545/g.159585 Transcript_51545/m.159585 type:complete len:312 (-) Transcript_51545:20-955(-)